MHKIKEEDIPKSSFQYKNKFMKRGEAPNLMTMKDITGMFNMLRAILKKLDAIYHMLEGKNE